jgi:hypothetical protein
VELTNALERQIDEIWADLQRRHKQQAAGE